jgi:putative endonuclease
MTGNIREMQNNSQKLGNDGELLAREHLRRQGYQIIATNWRYRKYEIDIISRKGDTMVFIEVKTRKNNIFGEPEVFVTKKKQNFLIAAANEYLIQHQIDLEARFDVIAIVSQNNNQVVNHLEDAFYPVAK